MSQNTLAGLRVSKVSDQPPRFNMLVYGESGAGKTTLAGSADEIAELRKVLLVDVEGGTLSIKEKYPNVDCVRVSSWDDMQKIYDELYSSPDTHGYSTLILDSLTEIQKLSMDRIMKSAAPAYDIEVPQIREWNINIEQTRKFVRAFRDLPISTIFTALVKTDVHKMTGQIKRKPYLSGKVADEVTGFLDIATYLYVKEVEQEQVRILLCGSTEDTVAKDRTNRLAMTILNPTMQIIWDAVRGIGNDSTTES